MACSSETASQRRLSARTEDTVYFVMDNLIIDIVRIDEDLEKRIFELSRHKLAKIRTHLAQLLTARTDARNSPLRSRSSPLRPPQGKMPLTLLVLAVRCDQTNARMQYDTIEQ